MYRKTMAGADPAGVLFVYKLLSSIGSQQLDNDRPILPFVGSGGQTGSGLKGAAEMIRIGKTGLFCDFQYR